MGPPDQGQLGKRFYDPGKGQALEYWTLLQTAQRNLVFKSVLELFLYSKPGSG